MRILYQVLFLKDIEHGERCSTCKVVATEGCAKLTIYRLKLRRYQYATHRETVADALSYGNHIRTNAEPLVSEELTATAIATLYLVADEHGTILLASSLQTLCKLWSNHVATTYALNGFDDTSANIALSKFLLPSLKVVDRKIGDMTISVDRSDNLRIVRYLNGKRSTTMEGFLYREHASSAVGERSQLQCILVSFGTRVDEEELIVVVATCFA